MHDTQRAFFRMSPGWEQTSTYVFRKDGLILRYDANLKTFTVHQCMNINELTEGEAICRQLGKLAKQP